MPAKAGKIVLALVIAIAMAGAIFIAVSMLLPQQERPAAATTSTTFAENAITDTPAPKYPLEYPAAWLITDFGGISAGHPVKVMYLPDIDIIARRNGGPVSQSEMEEVRAQWDFDWAGQAVVKDGENIICIPASLLLVNLPDISDELCFDVFYSYSSTSRCAGQEIPGVTGHRLEGYADGKQTDAYLARDEFVCPCAYNTALKTLEVSRLLSENGYRLLVYDSYRPMSAQYQLADKFAAAYSENQAIRDGIGGWSLDWFVADGPSGHNFGTDMDVGVCDMNGIPLEMPSLFDAFDETGHLCTSPMNASSISEVSYREAVSQNPACLALHRAFVEAGFSELASEWWHFGDDGTQYANAAVAGGQGLDFKAELPEAEPMLS